MARNGIVQENRSKASKVEVVGLYCLSYLGLIMKATLKNIHDILGIHGKGVKFTKKINPTNGYSLEGFLNRTSINDLDHQFHIYFKDGKIHVITTGRLSVSQKGI